MQTTFEAAQQKDRVQTRCKYLTITQHTDHWRFWTLVERVLSAGYIYIYSNIYIVIFICISVFSFDFDCDAEKLQSICRYLRALLLAFAVSRAINEPSYI